jgi:hypothetical protein
VGRGGISLTPPRPFNPGFSAGFSLGFAEERLPARNGWGMLRWCEMIAEQTRAGIEFMYLLEASRQSFAGWLEKERPSSFIPKE